MKIPAVAGLIRRRILVNFRVKPHVAQRLLPPGFEPKVVEGRAIAGICLIRLEEIRPRLVPLAVGLSSENAAHRIAAFRKTPTGEREECVYVFRRDSDSRLIRFAGGLFFSGEHHLASFHVHDAGDEIDLTMRSSDGETAVELVAEAAPSLPTTSRFHSLAEASAFFEAGSLGYSPSGDAHRLDAVELRMSGWSVEPLAIRHVFASFFADERLFPEGSVEFDSALLMRNVEHEWHSAEAVLLTSAHENAMVPEGNTT
jgi:uncharacterized protein YqjF (DUF2071 family)